MGLCLQLDMASQGNTCEEAVENLSEAVQLYLSAPCSSLKEPPFDVVMHLQSKPGCRQMDFAAAIVLPLVCEPLLSKFTNTPASWSFRNLRFRLEAAGFDHVFQLGSHAKFVCEETPRRACILPHYKELSASVVQSIFRQAEVSFT